MSEKTVKLIGIGVAVVLVVYLAAGLVSRGASRAAVSELEPMTAALQAAQAGDLESIIVESPNERVELIRGGPTGWQVNGFRADSALVAAIDQALASATVSHVASTNPSNHTRLGVAEDSTWRVELRRAGGTTELLVGTAGPSYPSSYVRLPDQPEVYVVKGDLGHSLRRRVVDWRDRKILGIDTARVATIHATRPEGSYTVTRTEDGWAMGRDGADTRMVSDILEQLHRFEAQDFPEEGVELGQVVRSLVALDSAGDTLAYIRLSRPSEYAYHGMVSGDPLLYEIANWRVERLTPERARVVRPAQPTQ